MKRVNSLDDIADKIAASLDQSAKSRSEYIGSLLSRAQLVKRARDKFPSNNEFGKWLEDKKLDISKDDRAALIGIADNLAEAEAYFKARDDRFSARRCWEAINPSSQPCEDESEDTDTEDDGRDDGQGQDVVQAIQAAQARDNATRKSRNAERRKKKKPAPADVLEVIAAFEDVVEDYTKVIRDHRDRIEERIRIMKSKYSNNGAQHHVH